MLSQTGCSKGTFMKCVLLLDHKLIEIAVYLTYLIKLWKAWVIETRAWFH